VSDILVPPSPDHIQINDIEDLQNLIEELIDLLGENEDEIFIPRIQINPESDFGLHLKLSGDKYRSTITTPVIKALLDAQKELSDLFSEIKYGRVKKLADDEKHRLELVTEVREGSSELFSILADPVNFILSLLEAGAMSPEALTSIIITLIIVGGVVGISKTAIEALKDRVRGKVSISLSEQETERLKLVVSNKIEDVENYQRKFERRLAQTDAREISLPSGEVVAPEELKTRTASERRKATESHFVIEDDFKIVKITIDHEFDELFADMIRVSTGELIPMVNLQKNFKSADLHTPVEKSLDKEPIKLQISVHYKNDKIDFAYLSKVYE
jgi:hypothetical protein